MNLLMAVRCILYQVPRPSGRLEIEPEHPEIHHLLDGADPNAQDPQSGAIFCATFRSISARISVNRLGRGMQGYLPRQPSDRTESMKTQREAFDVSHSLGATCREHRTS